MEKVFDVEVVTRDGCMYSGKAVSLVAPSGYGYLGVLADHAPLIASLEKGTIRLRDAAGKLSTIDFKVSGFLHVVRNMATILLT